MKVWSLNSTSLYHHSMQRTNDALRKQCNTALGFPRHTASSPPMTEVALMSCILFITFEYLDDRCYNGINLVQSGLKLLRQWRSSASSIPETRSEIDLVEDHLALVFARCKLSILDSPEVEVSPLKVRLGSEKTAREAALTVPPIFLNLEHAQRCLQALLGNMFASLTSLVEGLAPKSLMIHRQYEEIL